MAPRDSDSPGGNDGVGSQLSLVHAVNAKWKPWTPWRSCRPAVTFSPEALAETLDGGQAFRWLKTKGSTWEGIWGKCVARLKLDKDGTLLWSCPEALRSQVEDALAYYLGADLDYREVEQSSTFQDDQVMRTALDHCPGLRILRQPVEETLLAFLCSATKQIVQIKQMCQLLAERLGEPLGPRWHSLPTWEKLHTVTEAELRTCKLGFRARYIKLSAETICENPRFFTNLRALPYCEAKEELRTLSGVGEKIADCVALFGLGHWEAFPVDVWMSRAMNRLYRLEDRSPSQTAVHGRTRFGAYAGLAQQYLFAAERHR